MKKRIIVAIAIIDIINNYFGTTKNKGLEFNLQEIEIENNF